MPLLLSEAQYLLGDLGEWGSGWWNVRTRECFQCHATVHAKILIDNAEQFGISHMLDIWETQEVALEELNGNYSSVYDGGWLRYLWAKDDQTIMLAGSGTATLLAQAWKDGMIHGLYRTFQPTISYWIFDEPGPKELPCSSPNDEADAGDIPESIKNWFYCIFYWR